MDRRLGEHLDPDKRCILVMRETFPADDLAERIGGKRTLTFVIPRENQTDVGALAARFIASGTTILADESDAYDLLHGSYPMRRVNHQQQYRAGDGTTTTRRSRTSRVFAGCRSASTTTLVWPTSPTTPTRRPIVRTPGAESNGAIFSDILTKCAHTRPHGTGAAIGRATPPCRAPGGLSLLTRAPSPAYRRRPARRPAPRPYPPGAEAPPRLSCAATPGPRGGPANPCGPRPPPSRRGQTAAPGRPAGLPAPNAGTPPA